LIVGTRVGVKRARAHIFGIDFPPPDDVGVYCPCTQTPRNVTRDYRNLRAYTYMRFRSACYLPVYGFHFVKYRLLFDGRLIGDIGAYGGGVRSDGGRTPESISYDP